MSIINRFIEQARRNPKRIVLPEAEDERVLQAARMALDKGISFPILLGSREKVTAQASRAGVSLEGIEVEDPVSSLRLGPYCRRYSELRGLPEAVGRSILVRPNYFAANMVAAGDADGMVGGVVYATEEIIMAAGMFIGLQEGASIPSSLFLIEIPGYAGGENGVLIFADCAVNANPTAQELAEIAITSARSAERVCRWQPRVAMLSFSTKGSAAHPDVDKVTNALEIARKLAPDLVIDGELQADSALVPSTARRKIKGGNPVAGRANVLIFPDLDAANISYKLVQVLGGAAAFGPVLQGYRKPVSDLSRGATAEEIIGAMAIVNAQAQSQEDGG